jgi:zinc protease
VFPVGKTADPTSPSSRLGLATLTTAVWDEGTKNRTAGQIADELGGLGADVSFSAGWDVSSARLFSLKSRLPQALDIYADMLVSPIFPEKDIDREKKMMLGQLMQIRSQPVMLAQMAVGPTLYGKSSPYGQPLLGTPESIRAIDRKEIEDFFHLYRPNGATMIVVGDVALEELVKELEGVFASWTSESAVKHGGTSELPPPQATRVILIDKAGAAQSVISMAELSANRQSPDYYALNVMNAIFGGQFMSRLNMNLRETKGYTYGAHSMFEWHVHAPGAFVASASVKTDVTAPALVEFLKEIDGLRGSVPIKADELNDAKEYLTRGYASEFETISQIAQRLETVVEYKLPDDYFNTMIPKLSAVTAADVLAAAKKYVQPDKLAIIVVGDRKKIEKSLKELPAGKNIELMKFDVNFRLVPEGVKAE